MNDPEYYKMEKRSTVYTYELYPDSCSAHKYMEYINNSIHTFISEHEDFVIPYYDVQIRHLVSYSRNYDDSGYPDSELFYIKTETDEEHKKRLTKDLSEMKEHFEKKIERILKHIANVKVEPLNFITEDKYREKRNKALTKLIGLSISDPTYTQVLRQVKKYSPEGLEIENNKRNQGKLEAIAEMHHTIQMYKNCLEKTQLLITTLKAMYPETDDSTIGCFFEGKT